VWRRLRPDFDPTRMHSHATLIANFNRIFSPHLSGVELYPTLLRLLPFTHTQVGCGTVMDIHDAKAAMDAGAEFLVAPVLVPEVITWCAIHNIVIIPGCQTPTEAYNAFKAGAPIQKIFPGVAGGHMWVKAVSAALPMLTLNPTSGVDLDNAGDFLKNGAASVGLVAPLFPPDAIAGQRWDMIEANARKVISNVEAVGPYKRK